MPETAYHKQRNNQTTGPKEQELFDLLQNRKAVTCLRAREILDGEISLKKFLKRHEQTLALWWTDVIIHSVKL